MSAKLEIMEINNKGLGVISKCEFSEGDTVVKGKVEKTLTKRTVHSSTINGKHVLMTKYWRLVNHSCEPNCKVVLNESGVFDIVAMKKISVGKEITKDMETYEYEVKFFVEKCLCGNANCRGTIRGWKYLSDKVKKNMNIHELCLEK